MASWMMSKGKKREEAERSLQWLAIRRKERLHLFGKERESMLHFRGHREERKKKKLFKLTAYA